MKKYIFLWEYPQAWNEKEGRFETFCDTTPRPMGGSFAVRKVDGRMNINSILCEAVAFAKKTEGCAGFSVGYLTSHDPENKYIQSIIKFTEI